MITKQEVMWLAKLAKLNIEADELDKLTKDMDEIVAFASQIDSAVADGDEYKGNVINVEELREDEVIESTPQELVLSNSGGGERGFFPLKRRKTDGK